ncbi:MAG: primosomal protein N' [Verrucomicrobiota bacterium]|nr:primosomal protein N' [Verrucomicrobiota bacterium]
MPCIAEVAVERRKALRFDYSIPEEWREAAQVGVRVAIPLQGKTAKGVIVALKESSQFENLLPITELLSPTSELSAAQWRLAGWMARYYATPLELVLRLFIPAPIRQDVKSRKGKEETLLLEADFFQSLPKTLNPEQKACLDHIKASLQSEKFKVHLIHGITGSGKTEIYLQAIEEARRLGKAALFLVPEISLTSQTLERIRARFQEPVALLHHRRSLGERNAAWRKLASGEISIAIGARSALFAPIPRLGVIILDEEHDSSYKQSEEAPCYHARSVAIMRAHMESATVLLGSATPSLESRYNAEIGKYQLHSLTRRASSATLPTIQIVDMKAAHLRNGGFTHFSDHLLKAIESRIKKGEQTLLFLNRRGHHRLGLCRECQTAIQCPHCDLSLTFHKGEEQLRCHLCGFERSANEYCPSCGSRGTIQCKGFGTEHVERSLHAVFPEVRTLRMDRDTTRKKESHEELFQQFRAHKADVLIGTQMIAKGFHFPSVTLVGILHADASLQIPDFRSSEFLFQLLIQVSGRAGRADLPGEVILQTFLPEHPVILLGKNQDYDAFYTREMEERKLFGYPPFTHLIKCLFSSKKSEKALEAAEWTWRKIQELSTPALQILPVGPSGHPKIKDLFRFQFLIKAKERKECERVSLFLSSLSFPDAYIKVDVDPSSLW